MCRPPASGHSRGSDALQRVLLGVVRPAITLVAITREPQATDEVATQFGY